MAQAREPRRGRGDPSVRVQRRAARRPASPPTSPRAAPRCSTSLAPAVRALGGTDDDAEFVRDLALARMNDAIAHRRVPSRAETQRLVAFCLAGITGSEVTWNESC